MQNCESRDDNRNGVVTLNAQYTNTKRSAVRVQCSYKTTKFQVPTRICNSRLVVSAIFCAKVLLVLDG